VRFVLLEVSVVICDAVVRDLDDEDEGADDVMVVVVSKEKTTFPPEAKEAETAAAAPDTIPWKSSVSSLFKRSRRMS